MRTRATGVPPVAKHAKGSYEVRLLAVRLNDVVRVARVLLLSFVAVQTNVDADEN